MGLAWRESAQGREETRAPQPGKSEGECPFRQTCPRLTREEAVNPLLNDRFHQFTLFFFVIQYRTSYPEINQREDQRLGGGVRVQPADLLPVRFTSDSAGEDFDDLIGALMRDLPPFAA